MHGPLSAEFGQDKTAEAKFWPWLEPFVRPTFFKCFELFPFRSAAAVKSAARRKLMWSSGVTLNIARPDMNNYAALGVMLYEGIGGSKDFALWELARRATLGFVLC